MRAEEGEREREPLTGPLTEYIYLVMHSLNKHLLSSLCTDLFTRTWPQGQDRTSSFSGGGAPWSPGAPRSPVPGSTGTRPAKVCDSKVFSPGGWGLGLGAFGRREGGEGDESPSLGTALC